MTTSTLRGIILAAAVIVGFVGLTKAFPSRSATFRPAPEAKPTPSVEPSASPSRSTASSPSPAPSASARVEGVVVQVLNGSGVDFLAATVSDRLKEAGYSVKPPGNANHTPSTIVYFQAGFKPEADALEHQFFPNASVKPATQAAASDADITVILGEDAGASPSG